MITVTLIDIIKSLINTLVRLAPISFYMGSGMSAMIFSDFRGVLLFGGFMLNEFIALGYRMVMKGEDRRECALTLSGDGTPFVLPAPITQTVGFFVGFIMADMYAQNTFNPIKFALALVALFITIYSRINVACKSIVDALYCAILGIIIGVVYYVIVKDYYRPDYLNMNGGVAGVASNIESNLNNFFSVKSAAASSNTSTTA